MPLPLAGGIYMVGYVLLFNTKKVTNDKNYKKSSHIWLSMCVEPAV